MNLLERDNNSGLGKGSDVPEELGRWNWGAFLLGWIWGLGNKSYKTFLVFIPYAGIYFLFANGSRGNRWAWQNKDWKSIEQFKRVQRRWAIAGAIVAVSVITIATIGIISFHSYMKNSEVAQKSLRNIERTDDFIRKVGHPYEMGIVSGKIKTSGTNGSAEISYKVDGPNGRVEVYAKGIKSLGNWSINCEIVQYAADLDAIIIVPCE